MQLIFPDVGIPLEKLTRFVPVQDVDLVIAGCSIPGEAQQLAYAWRENRSMTDDDQTRLIEAFRPYAERFAFYRRIIYNSFISLLSNKLLPPSQQSKKYRILTY